MHHRPREPRALTERREIFCRHVAYGASGAAAATPTNPDESPHFPMDSSREEAGPGVKRHPCGAAPRAGIKAP